MLGFVKRLIGRNDPAPTIPPVLDWWDKDFFAGSLAAPKPPSRDLTKLCDELLSALPRCTAKVVVAGPSYYDNKHHMGDVIADTAALLLWAEKRAEPGLIFSDDAKQAAMKILPVWLRDADLANPTLSMVTAPFREFLNDWSCDLIEKKIALVHCPECRYLVSDVDIQHLNPRNDGVFDWTTYEWRCSAGHLLRSEEFGMRLFCRR